MAHAEFRPVLGRPPLDGVTDIYLGLRHVVRVHPRFPIGILVADFIGSVAELTFPLVRKVHFVCGEVPVPEPDIRALERELGKMTTLETIYLEGNPCQRNDQGGYRRKVILALPQVTQVDATYVSDCCVFAR